MVSFETTVHSHRYLAEVETESNHLFFELDSFEKLDKDYNTLEQKDDPMYRGTLSCIDVTENTDNTHTLLAFFIERGEEDQNYRATYSELEDITEQEFFMKSHNIHSRIFEEESLSSIVLSNTI